MIEQVKILQLAKHFFPDAGGIETVTRSISDMLPAHGIRADVLCTAVGDFYPALDLPYRVIRCRPGLRFGRNKSLSFEYVRQIRSLRAEYDAALIHLPNPVAVAAALAWWTKPIILLWHADIPQPAIRRLAAPFDRALSKRAAAVIGPTPVHLEASHHAATLVPSGTIIAYPFERSRLPVASGASVAAAKVRAFLGGRKLVLSVGRLIPYKGFEVLIDAARRLDPQLAAVIVGDGPLMGALQDAIAAAGVADRVMLAGSVDDDALADLLDLAFVGCLPSVTEAEMYGMVQVEAMAFGKPMVSTRLPRSGVPCVNRHDETGLLVEPRDPVALAAALNRLADDPILYRRLADGAAESFRTDHDIASTGRAYAELIRSVLSREPGREAAPRPGAAPPLAAKRS